MVWQSPGDPAPVPLGVTWPHTAEVTFPLRACFPPGGAPSYGFQSSCQLRAAREHLQLIVQLSHFSPLD